MPFVKPTRIVEPIYVLKGLPTTATRLSSKASTPCINDGDETDQESTKSSLKDQQSTISLDTTDYDFWANGALCNVLRQLASVARISHEIFTELHDELNSISDRSVKLRQRLVHLDDITSKLDAKKVKIRPSLFVDDPPLGASLEVFPSSSKAGSTIVKSSTADSGTGGSSIATDNEDELQTPASSEKQLKLSTEERPAKFVPIDVSGVGFQRMSWFRTSLLHKDFVIKRKKAPGTRRTQSERRSRRATVCESEPETGADHKQGRLVRRRSHGSLDQVHIGVQTEDMIGQLFLEHRAKQQSQTSLAQKSTSAKASPSASPASSTRADHRSEVQMIDELEKSPGERRKKTLERASTSKETHKRSENHSAKDESSQSKRISTGSQINGAHLVQLREGHTAKGSGDDGRSSSGNWSASSSTHASLDSDHNPKSSNHQRNRDTQVDPELRSSNSSLGKESDFSECLNSPSSSNHRQLNHLPERLKNPHDFNSSQGYASDISSAAETTAAKSKAESSKKAVEEAKKDGDKEAIKMRNNTCANKPTFANRDSESWLKYMETDKESNGSGDERSSSVTPTSSSHDVPTSLANGQAKGDDTRSKRAGTASPTSVVSTSGSIRSQRTLTGHDDEGGASDYSCDADGFYTSFHTDCGLFRGRKGLMKLVLSPQNTPNNSFRVKNHGRQRDSIASIRSEVSLNSVLSLSDHSETPMNSQIQLNTDSGTIKKKQPPPPPPRRGASRLTATSIASGGSQQSLQSGSGVGRKHMVTESGQETNGTGTPATSSRSHSPSPATTTTSSIDDHHLRTQFINKTTIDSGRYPSLCAAITSTENSDSDEVQGVDPLKYADDSSDDMDSASMISSRSNKSNSRSNKRRPLSTGSQKGFRIKDIIHALSASASSTSINKEKNRVHKPSNSDKGPLSINIPRNMYGDDEPTQIRSVGINPARHRVTPTANVEGLEKRRVSTFTSADDSDSGTSYSSKGLVNGSHRRSFRGNLQIKQQLSAEERARALAAQRFPVSRITPVPVPQPPPTAKYAQPTFRKPPSSTLLSSNMLHQRPTSLNLTPQNSSASTVNPSTMNTSSSMRASTLMNANHLQSRIGARVQLNPYGEIIYASPPSSQYAMEIGRRPLPMRPSPRAMMHNPMMHQLASPSSIASSHSSYSSLNGNHPQFTSPGSPSHPIYNHNYPLDNNNQQLGQNALSTLSSPLSPQIYGTRTQGPMYDHHIRNENIYSSVHHQGFYGQRPLPNMVAPQWQRQHQQADFNSNRLSTGSSIASTPLSAPQRSSWGSSIGENGAGDPRSLTQRCMTPLVLMQSPTSPASRDGSSMLFSPIQPRPQNGSYFTNGYGVTGSLSRPARPTSAIGFEGPGSPLSPQSPPSGHRNMLSSSSTDTSMSSLSGIPPMKPSRLTTEDLLNLIHQGKRRDDQATGSSNPQNRMTSAYSPGSSFTQAASSSLLSGPTAMNSNNANAIALARDQFAKCNPGRSGTPMVNPVMPLPRNQRPSNISSAPSTSEKPQVQPRSASAIPFSSASSTPKPSAAQTVVGSRRSWYFEQNQNQPGSRRSLACDRLGPSKPTSINDFKRLLVSKARPPSAPGGRRSAAELLQVKTSPQSLSSLLSPSSSSSSSAGSTPRRPFTPLVLSQETSPGQQSEKGSPPKVSPKPQMNGNQEPQKPSQFHGQLYPIGASGHIIKPRVLRTTPRRHYLGGGMNGYMTNGTGTCLPILEENREETGNQESVHGHGSVKDVRSLGEGQRMGHDGNPSAGGMIAVARPAHVEQSASSPQRSSPDGRAKTPNPSSTSTWV